MPSLLLALALGCAESPPPPPDELTPLMDLGAPVRWSCDPCAVHDLEVQGHTAWLADRKRGLAHLDFSDPTSPVERSLLVGGSPVSVRLAGERALLGDWNRGLVVVDLAGQSPMELAVHPTVYTAYDVEALGELALVGGEVVDLSQPASPRRLARLPVGPRANGAHLSGALLVVAASSDGLELVDLTQPAQPSLLSRIEADYARDVLVVGSLAYVSESHLQLLRVVDISDPLHPVPGAEVPLPGPPGEVDVLGGKLFVPVGLEGVVVLDLADPAQPRSWRHIDLGAHDAQAVEATPQGIWVADGVRGVLWIRPLYSR